MNASASSETSVAPQSDPSASSARLRGTGGLAAWRRVFEIDVRSLALFRITLALALLADLFARSFDMRVFYTDQGVLPRAYWLMLSNPWQFSIHGASGELWWQILLFMLAALFALGLLVGYRSRFMMIGSFILLASLINRNGQILQAGDSLLVVLCFWGMFLPVGARYSIDAALLPRLRESPNAIDGGEGQPCFSAATIAVILQVLFLYFFTAILKTGDAWRVRFDAAWYAINLQHFATPIGIWMRQFPDLLRVATVYVLVVEFVAPILVLLPWLWPRLRILGWLLMLSLHAAFALMLYIGLFPLIDFVALSLLIPSALWLWLRDRGHRTRSDIENIVIFYDRDCGFCLKMCLILREVLLPRSVKILPAQDTPEIGAILERENSWVVRDARGNIYTHWRAMQFLFSRRWPFKPVGWVMGFAPLMAIGHRVYLAVAANRGELGEFTARVLPYRPLPRRLGLIGSLLAVFFFYVVLSLNLATIPGWQRYATDTVQAAAGLGRLDQRWDMFAPFPLTYSHYPIITGKLRNGETVNVYPLTAQSDQWQPPENFYRLYESYRWRKYLERIESTRDKRVLEAYGSFLCQSWNRPSLARQRQMGTLDVEFEMHATNTTGEPKTRTRKLVWRHWCLPEFMPKNPS